MPEVKKIVEATTSEINQIMNNTQGKEGKKGRTQKLKEIFHIRKNKKIKGTENNYSDDEAGEGFEIKKAEIKPQIQEKENSFSKIRSNSNINENEKPIKKILIEPIKEDYTDYNQSLYEPDETPEEEQITDGRSRKRTLQSI